MQISDDPETVETANDDKAVGHTTDPKPAKAVAKPDRATVQTRAVGAALRPETIEGMWRMAQAVAKAPILPDSYRGRMSGRGHDRRFLTFAPDEIAGNVFIAVQHGAEIGLAPMQSIQSIAVINNRPALWGDAVIGIVRASGKCKYIKEWIEGDGKEAVAHCESKRLPSGETIKRSFSMKDAETAGLASKDTYQNYPKRMLQQRARGFCLRDLYADLLKGLHSAEELKEVLEMQQRADGSYEPSQSAPERPRRADFDAEAAAQAQEARDKEAMDTAYAGATDQPAPETVAEETEAETLGEVLAEALAEPEGESEGSPETEPEAAEAVHPYETTMRETIRACETLGELDGAWDEEERNGNLAEVAEAVRRTLDNVYQMRRVELRARKARSKPKA